MTNEELNEILKELETVRVEMLDEGARRLFYTIMKIADERDKLEKENQRLISVLREIRLDLMFNYKALKIKKLNSNDLTDSYWLGYVHAYEEVFDKINELKESDK